MFTISNLECMKSDLISSRHRPERFQGPRGPPHSFNNRRGFCGSFGVCHNTLALGIIKAWP